MAYTSTAVKRRYNEKAYDRIYMVVPKGKKEEWTKAAEEAGMSLASYIRETVENRIAEDRKNEEE